MVDDLNGRLWMAGMPREFYIERIALVYNKNQTTDCQPSLELNQDNGYLPEEYCNHPSIYLFMIADEAVAYNWVDVIYPSLEWHGIMDANAPPGSPHYLFTTNGLSVLAHEAGHILGLPNTYALKIAAEDNQVTGVAFSASYNPWEGDIMYDVSNAVFSAWGAEIVDRENVTFPFRYYTWFDYVPEDTVLKLRDATGNPLVGAQVNIYRNETTHSGEEHIN
jgi:hypothetical protein